jgi:hypothetical protein
MRVKKRRADGNVTVVWQIGAATEIMSPGCQQGADPAAAAGDSASALDVARQGVAADETVEPSN